MNQPTHAAPFSSEVPTLLPIFYPTPDTRVCLFDGDLPSSCALAVRSTDHDGLLVVVLVFRQGMTATDRAATLRRSETLSPELVAAIADEITRGSVAQAVTQ
ncbi:hypothetical protein [Nocardiopsis tropica]|uniref:Uncharacterized protein n=1 Tax=Nocardiopsis tropica TaxID=109330 RepID=A0ABU7KMZ9_9ACTN|nr:hypothetical protein [Nocardiopsis umidischolae]MEE2050052.1 hypothetical protein [Nocardiopsis umidischolae]